MKKNISLVICAVYLLCLFSVSAEAVQTNPTYKEHETAVEMLTSSSEEAVPEETQSEETSAEITEEATSAGMPEETTSAEVPEETTSAALPEETTSAAQPEETTSAASPEETTSAEQPEETTSISEETTTAVTPEETTTVPPEETTVATPTAAPEEATPSSATPSNATSSNATAAIDGVISLKVPNSIDFWMDQYGLKRGAQIYSQEYTIQNNGSMRILAKLTDIRCMVTDDVISVGDEWSDEEVRESEEKVVKLVIHMSNGDMIMVTEQASEYQLILEPGEEVTFTIEGCLSGTIHNQWQTGDVLIELVYGAEQY